MAPDGASSCIEARPSVHCERLVEILRHDAAVIESFATAASTAIASALRDRGKVLCCGCGGSAAMAQHFAAELVGRFRRERRGLAAMSLAADASALTALVNDYGPDAMFERQVEAFARPGDVFVAMSTSGRSNSVVRAASRARDAGCTVVAMTGPHGLVGEQSMDVRLRVRTEVTATIQEVHLVAMHRVVDRVETLVVDALEDVR